MRGKLAYVTTLLASVERCSGPEMNPPRNPLHRHHAACQRGAVFKMLDAVIGAMSGSEHGSTLTSSVVPGVREVISATVAKAGKDLPAAATPVAIPSRRMECSLRPVRETLPNRPGQRLHRRNPGLPRPKVCRRGRRGRSGCLGRAQSCRRKIGGHIVASGRLGSYGRGYRSNAPWSNGVAER